jgi:hypothetical protein
VVPVNAADRVPVVEVANVNVVPNGTVVSADCRIAVFLMTAYPVWPLVNVPAVAVTAVDPLVRVTV